MNIVVEIVKKLGRDDVRSKTLSQGDSFESGVEVGFSEVLQASGANRSASCWYICLSHTTLLSLLCLPACCGNRDALVK